MNSWMDFYGNITGNTLDGQIVAYPSPLQSAADQNLFQNVFDGVKYGFDMILNPQSPLNSGVRNTAIGYIGGLFNAVGQTAGGVVGQGLGGLGSGIVSGITKNPDGSFNLNGVAMIAAVGLGAYLIMKK